MQHCLKYSSHYVMLSLRQHGVHIAAVLNSFIFAYKLLRYPLEEREREDCLIE